tara:strand:- start:122 stop:502 length:381 start_codon:yes stop_codon:yes gene_type:complete
MGMFFIHQPSIKKKKLTETKSLLKARAEHRKFLISKGIDPDRKVNRKDFKVIPNWWETPIQTSAPLAHSVEQLICNQQVVCSNRTRGTKPVKNWRLEESKKFTVAPAYNKGAYQVISKNSIKDIGR